MIAIAQARRASMPRLNQALTATSERVIQPSVPEWTWVSSWSWLNSTRSRPLRIPIPIVTRNTAIATKNSARTWRAQPPIPPAMPIDVIVVRPPSPPATTPAPPPRILASRSGVVGAISQPGAPSPPGTGYLRG